MPHSPSRPAPYAGVANSDYEPPVPITPPPIYAWPPRPLAVVRWFVGRLLYPWVGTYLVLSLIIWKWLLPPEDQMATLQANWILQIWVRNLAVLTLVAGGLHWTLYVRRRQGDTYKFNRRWPVQGRKYLFGDQVKDNAFWTLTSGGFFLTAYEALTHWAYASGLVDRPGWVSNPAYIFVMATLGVVLWSTIHFWANHRLLHWEPLYRAAHHLHHRNINPGPWSGISMHPAEHLIYFSLFLLWWVVPVHPVVILMCGFYQGPGPAPSHSGFERVRIVGRWQIPAGDLFHQLHHRYFEVNYGNTQAPIDRATGTWHDGTLEAHERLKGRRRADQIA